MRYIKLFVPAFLLLMTYSTAQIQNIGSPDIQNYKRTDYKGGTQNWDIDQDKNGNLYFANTLGIFQFDGSSWRKYNIPNSKTVKCIKIDHSGKIFVGGYTEFGYLKSNSKGKMDYFSLSKMVTKNSAKLTDFIWKIHLYNNEVIFQSFERAYVFKNGKIKIIEAPKRFQFSFQVKNHLYFQDKSMGILEYKNGQLFQLKSSTTLNDTEIWGMFSLPENKLLIATLNKGLYIYADEKMIPWDTEANVFIRKNNSLGGVAVKDNYIVLNSVLNGIIVCDLNGRIIQHIDKTKGLQNNTVLSSFIDNKNNLWLGLDDGIAFINENSPFTYLGFSYNISTVYATTLHKGNLYVATNQGVFYHSWNNSIKEDTFKMVEGTTGQAWNLQVIDNQLFCAHNTGALLIVDGKATKILDKTGYWEFKQIPNHPNYIIGSNYNGFSVFEKQTNGWVFKTEIEGFSTSFGSFQVDEKSIWLKKNNSIYRMMLSENKKKFESIQTYENLSKAKNGIGNILLLGNRIYFQSNNHFYTYSYAQDNFIEDKKISSLFAKIPDINSLIEDKFGNMWYIFGESLGVLMKTKMGNFKNVVAPFSKLTANIVYDNLSINTISPNNTFIGLTNGLANYDSSKSINYDTRPKAYIRDFSFPGGSFVLENGQKKMDNYKIPYASNHVKFSFSSPSYENLENLEFSYQLEGFDNRWSNWSTNIIKEYTNLREGNYKMKIKARIYGKQSRQTILNFTILPPWYRSILAYSAYLLFIVAFVFLIRKRINSKIQKNKYYETIEQRRLYLEKESKIIGEQYELEKEIEKLKSDKLQIKILAKDKELVNNSLQVVKKNKILNGIITKLKEINVDSFDESAKLQLSKLNRSITKEVNTDKSWKDLEKHIKNVHFDFLKRLKEKHPTISPRELDLSTYLLMNMSTKEIAEIMNISNASAELSRYRLRKKLGLNKNENLIGFLMSI